MIIQISLRGHLVQLLPKWWIRVWHHFRFQQESVTLSGEISSSLSSSSKSDVVGWSTVLPEGTISWGVASSVGLINDESSVEFSANGAERWNETITCSVARWLLSWLNNDSCDVLGRCAGLSNRWSNLFEDLSFFAGRSWIAGCWPSTDHTSKSKRRAVARSREVQSTLTNTILLSLKHGRSDGISNCTTWINKVTPVSPFGEIPENVDSTSS